MSPALSDNPRYLGKKKCYERDAWYQFGASAEKPRSNSYYRLIVSASELDFNDEEEETSQDIRIPNVALMSKDKTIEYTQEVPNIIRRSASYCRLAAGPNTFASSRSVHRLSTFLLFIEPFEEIVVTMTNLYGERKFRSQWKKVDILSMRAYYGVLLLAGVYRSRGEYVTELWNDKTGRPIFREKDDPVYSILELMNVL